MYKVDLVLKNLQWSIYHKTETLFSAMKPNLGEPGAAVLKLQAEMSKFLR